MIVLDTHVWVWWVNSITGVLPDRVRNRIEDRKTRVGIASISCLEVAYLTKRGRIGLPCSLSEWFDLALAGSDIDLLPLSPHIAERGVWLPEIHKDPADRLIIATAMDYQATLLSKDEIVRRYPDVVVEWD